MESRTMQGISEILEARAGAEVCCAVKVWRKGWYGSTWQVRDAAGLAMNVHIPQERAAEFEPLFRPGACLVLRGTAAWEDDEEDLRKAKDEVEPSLFRAMQGMRVVRRGKDGVTLCSAAVLEDASLLRALEVVRTQRRPYDFEPTQYRLANSGAFQDTYLDQRIHPDDAFGQTVARLFGTRLAEDAVFAWRLYNALSFIDWVHHEKKLLREFWDGGTALLFRALGSRVISGVICRHILDPKDGVTREIEEAFRSEGWEYYESPGYWSEADEAEESGAAQQDIPVTPADHAEGRASNDVQPDARGQSACGAGQPFVGMSEVPVFRDFEKAVVRAFGERIARDRDYCIPVWNALAGTSWQDSDGRKITYRDEAADLLVSQMAGSDAFKNSGEELCQGSVLREIRKAMRQQGWKWLEDGYPDEDSAGRRFVSDVFDLFGDRAPGDRRLCEDIWATITSAAWYDSEGGSLERFGGRGDGGLMSDLCCRGYYLDWYCSEGGGLRPQVLDALRSRGWHPWISLERA